MTTLTPEMIAAGEAALSGFSLSCEQSKTTIAVTVYLAMVEAAPKVSRARKPRQENSAFRAFYAAYPRHEAPRDASSAFDAAILRGSLDAIMAGAKRYAEHCRAKEQKFIKLPATWLRADCWKDELKTGLSGANGYQSRFHKPG